MWWILLSAPDTHLERCREAADLGILIICQTPLAPTLKEAEEIVEYVSGKEFEPNGKDYLRSLAAQEAVYQSAKTELPATPVF